MEESIPNILGSPIRIPSSSANVGLSDSSYLVPPVASESSSTGAMESLVLPLVLVDDDNKENPPRPGIGVIAAIVVLRLFKGVPRMHGSLLGRLELFLKNIMGASFQHVVNALFEVLARLNPVSLPTPPFVVLVAQTTSSYANCLAITAMLDRLTMNCLQYEAVLNLEELVGAAEHLYILYPWYEWMGDSFFHMSAVPDGHWVNQLVGEDGVPRFRFYDDLVLMGEDRDDVINCDGNNDE